MARNITVLTDAALITCIVQKGMGEKVVQAATAAGAQGATVYYGRGSGVRERLGLFGLAVDVEKEVIDIIVAVDQRDRIFERIYFAAQLDTPGMGLAYLTMLEKVATYVPPEVAARLANERAKVD